MADPAQQNGSAAGGTAAPAQSLTAPTPAPAVANSPDSLSTQTPDPIPPASSASQSQSPSASRPLYMPQFSAATQMILKRMKSEAAGLASGPSVAQSPPPEILPDLRRQTYEDVKRRVIMGMSTSSSMTLQMPAAPRPTPPPLLPAPTPRPQVGHQATAAPARPKMATGAAGLSAIRRVTMGLTASGRPIVPKPAQQRTPTSAEPKDRKTKAAPGLKAGTKRKRGAPRQDDDTSSLTSLSGLSGDEDGASDKPATPSAPPILTKSGRHVQKPTTYNPAEMESSSSKKRVHYSKVRTAEQALCKKCTRMHSPASNQMVFCDGCNEGWHQMCHDPWIDDEAVKDTNKAWFCAACQARRDRHFAAAASTSNHPQPNKRQKVAAAVRESWAGHTSQQKRAYLSTLPQQELVGLLMYSLELHPDLPIFPGTADSAATTTAPSTPGTPNTPSDTHASGRKGGRAGSTQKGAKGTPAQQQQQQQQQQHQENDEEIDPLEPPWPKPGRGLYNLLPPEEDDDFLADDNDFEAFSVIVYDEKGRKIEENGMQVVRV